MMNLRCVLFATVAAVLLPQGSPAAGRKAASSVQEGAVNPAELRKIVEDIQIPYQSFTLANGLDVIVITDRAAPVVYVGVFYDVGAVHEPEGKSGFAHLFEHLMFNGSENLKGDYFTYLRQAGMIGANGTTSADMTSYYQTVPVGSLDRVLFMESDRMGHLLGAITHGVLDEQRGVVQNEKRNKDNDPTSILNYRTRAALYPPGHPYAHAPIGSMKDLNAASLADVHQWFKDRYGPNNATLILAGDIDLATAKAKVEKYFGDIPRGKQSVFPMPPVPLLKAPVEETLTGPVSSATIRRSWAVPPAGTPAAYALSALAGTMTDVDDAPLYETLVRRDKLFRGLSAGFIAYRGSGDFTIAGRVRPGADPKAAERALDAAIAKFLATGPSADALARWKSSTILDRARGLELPEQRAAILANTVRMKGTPVAYKKDLEAYLALTPADVAQAGRTWLGRPGYRAVLMPGARMIPPDDVAAPGGTAAKAPPSAVVPAQAGTRGPVPGVGAPGSVTLPPIQHATLTNGIPITYIQTKNTPDTRVTLAFPLGTADAPEGKANAVTWMAQLLNQGAGGHDSHWFSQLNERTGIGVGGSASPTGTSFSMSGPTRSLDTVLSTGMMVLTQPTFPQDRIEERRRRSLTAIASAPTSVGSLTRALLSRELAPGSIAAELAQVNTTAEINGITRADLQAAYRRIVRPQGAKLVVTSAEPLAALLPKLNATLGRWSVPGPAEPAPVRVQATKRGTPRIVLIDIPGSVQGVVLGGQLISVPYSEDPLALNIANTALGGGFLSRLNMNLREGKHWSYGVAGGIDVNPLYSTYVVQTQVQPDKVGPAIGEIRKEVTDILGSRPVTKQEFDEAVEAALRTNVGTGRSSGGLLAIAKATSERDLPDDYYDKKDDRLRALTLDQANAALREQLDPSKWVWVVAGDAKVIRPQLDGLGLPVEVMTPAQVIANT